MLSNMTGDFNTSDERVTNLKLKIFWDVMACQTADGIYPTTQSNTQEDVIFSVTTHNLKSRKTRI